MKTNKEVSNNNETDWQAIVNFFFEAGMLKKTPRSGYQFLGSGQESVAEHSFRAIIVAYVLGQLTPQADTNKLIKMVLFHDLAEARTGDSNYVNKRYVKTDELSALKDSLKKLFFGQEVLELSFEFNERQTLEALLAGDADQLDMILELQEQKNLGNPFAEKWLLYAGKRLKTEAGQKLFQKIIKSDHTDWWFEKRPELWSK